MVRLARVSLEKKRFGHVVYLVRSIIFATSDAFKRYTWTWSHILAFETLLLGTEHRTTMYDHLGAHGMGGSAGLSGLF